MNVFFDTNIVLEFLADRPKAKQVEQVFVLCGENEWRRFISVGSVYTIAYMTERILHEQGFVRPNLVEEQRKIFQSILDYFEIVPLRAEGIAAGTEDKSFSDLEDSFQYQSAVQADCDVLLTLNLKDFKDVGESGIKIMEPKSFLSKFAVEK